MAFPASSLDPLSADLLKVSPPGELSQGLQVQSPMTYGRSKTLASSTPTSLVFVDSRVVDATALLGHSTPGTEVVYLNAIDDAVTQITRTLLNYSGISSLHILSHGTSGGLTFCTRLANCGKPRSIHQPNQVLVPSSQNRCGYFALRL